jgi:hypothetical protein
LLVSATEVAVTVTVWLDEVAAGSFNVAEVTVWPERVPAVALHVTPPLFLSLVTVAVRVIELPPSAVVAEAVIETLTGAELPPQLANQHETRIATHHSAHLFPNIRASNFRECQSVLVAISEGDNRNLSNSLVFREISGDFVA